MLLEHCQTAEDHFTYLSTVLTDLYPSREANTIATYIFEDLFQPIDGAAAPVYWTEKEQAVFERVVKELREHRPWQYVVGSSQFYGLSFYVDEQVLIPRPETEELVHFMIKRHKDQPIKILDVGTGSGCIAITLQKNLPAATVTALDVSDGALAIAQKNATANAVEVLCLPVDVLQAAQTAVLPRYQVIVSNPPYIPSTDQALMRANVLEHEPHLALFVTDNDSLQFYKVLAILGREKLQDEGWLYVEIHEDFGAQVVALFQGLGYKNCQVFQDMYGKDRIVMAQL
ncbi:MAG: peptide chain release factor N(5)-glutamine methyltransferase [Aureispira sp.]